MAKRVSAEEQMMDELADEIERVSDAIAAEMGPAPGVEQLTSAQEVEFWGVRDPLVEYDVLVEVLQTTGLSPEMMDPKNKQGLSIAKVAPQLAPLYTQPVPDPALAHQLAAIAEYPMRWGFYANKSEAEMVAIAKRLDAAWTKKMGVAAPADTLPTLDRQSDDVLPTPAPVQPAPMPQPATPQMPAEMMGAMGR